MGKKSDWAKRGYPLSNSQHWYAVSKPKPHKIPEIPASKEIQEKTELGATLGMVGLCAALLAGIFASLSS